MEPLLRDNRLFRPRREEFIDPFNHKGWLEYFENLLPRFRYIRFVGLPTLKDIPDVPLERLYVPLVLGPRSQAPMPDGEEGESLDVGEALERSRHLLILGDPGSGKSTLISFLVTTFASRRRHPLAATLGPLIPFPFVLREFKIPENITFVDLVDQFLAERYWSPQLTRKELFSVLERGQGLVLLDGLDEIGDVRRREALRRAVLEGGLARFPRSFWVLTSRIVGYDDVPFDLSLDIGNGQIEHSARLKVVNQLESAIPVLLRLHLLPFSIEQIRRFVENWYAVREADPAQRRAGVESLLSAIQSSPSIKRLAHTPNLLQMMALIHRVYAQLPSGRALLYDRIAEAYLESIDEYRKIKESSVPASRHRRWLGALAYDLQRQRARAGADASEILISEAQVAEQMRRGLGPAVDTARELSYIARRSGLLLPRRPGYYSFVHLSFQEYFAACHLYDRLMGFETRKEAQREVTKLPLEPAWHESLVFLFEKLSDHHGAPDWLFGQLFPRGRALKEAEAVLASDLLGDLHTGLSKECLKRAAALVVETGFTNLSVALVDRVDALADSAGLAFLLREARRRVADHGQLGVEALFFMQNVALLKGHDLKATLGSKDLARAAANALYILHPMAWQRDGPTRRELVARLPMELWFATPFSDTPLLGLWDRRLPRDQWKRKDVLSWLAACDLFLGLLVIKSVVMNRAASELEMNEICERLLAPDRELFRARFDALVQAIPNPELDLALHRISSRALGLDLAEPLASARILAVARGLARISPMSSSLAGAFAILLTKDLHPSALEARHSWILNAVIRGDDAFVAPTFTSCSDQARPGLLILNHLGLILLGLGGAENWRQIQEQVEIVADPEWLQVHLTFLRPGEMETALRLLGLRMKDGGALLDAKWFEPSHPLAPALNARPSEFAASVAKLEDEYKSI